MRFVDEIEIVVASGKGGDGCISFRREKYVPRGGPDGGDGGRGGALVLEATSRRNTLVDFRRNKVYRARNGQAGMGRTMTGASGDDLVLPVPVGTVVFHRETGERLADLDEEGARWVLPGGRGGLGNIHFKSSTRRTPHKATSGGPAVEIPVRLELKLIADVGLLGFPNAGKSTLISRISAARPRVADYPFTTLVPNLGVVQLDPDSSFVVADVPGLVDGASDGVGLGHRFLRHVERCALYLHLVAPDHYGRTPAELVRALHAELAAYDARLAERPQVVVLTKIDLLTPEARDEAVGALEEAGFGKVLAVSAVSGEGVSTLVGRTWQLLGRLREERRSEEQSEPSGAPGSR
jgi:GTP-binding protein